MTFDARWDAQNLLKHLWFYAQPWHALRNDVSFFLSSLEVADWRKNIQAMHWCRWISQHLATGWLLGECFHFTTPGATNFATFHLCLLPQILDSGGWLHRGSGANATGQGNQFFGNADLNLRLRQPSQVNMPCVSTCAAALASFSGYVETLRDRDKLTTVYLV